MKKSLQHSLFGMLLCLLAFAGTNKLNAQDVEYKWAKAMGGTVSDIANSIAVDARGNVYTTGRFGGTVDFDPSAATANLVSNGGVDIFITKFDVDGNYVWAKAIGGANNDLGFGIAVDASGNVYTTGSFIGTVDFDPSAAVANIVSNGSADIFISKLNTNGNYVWAKRIGNSDFDEGRSIAVDASGNVYTTGIFRFTTDFDPGPATANLSNPTGIAVFISKLDANGNYVWAKAINGSFNIVGTGVAVDASGNVYTTGSFENTADFDPSAATANITSKGNKDIFVSKLDANGNYVWAKAMGGTNNDLGLGVAVDASGNVYTSGNYIGTADFDPSAAVANLVSSSSFSILYVNKLDVNGNYVWAKTMGALNTSANAIAIDAAGDVYTTGYFFGTDDFDPSAAVANIVSNGSADIFVSKLNTNGNYVWAKAMGGTSTDFGNSIAVDVYGNVYTTGYFKGTADFDPSAATANLLNNGTEDIFVSKLGLPCTLSRTSTSTTNLSICSSALPFSWNGLTFTTAGSQTKHLTNVAGCDSAATLNLTINTATASTSTTNLSICSSELPFSWNGLIFNAAGSQTAHLTNAAGCDSAAALNLSVITQAAQPTPAANNICVGSTLQLSNVTSGGVWTSITNRASVSNTGLVTGLNAGLATIKYKLASGATTTYNITVNAIPMKPSIAYAAGAINPQRGAGGSGNFCKNKTFTVMGVPSGGVWQSSNTSVLTIDCSNVINTVGNGSASLTYTYTSPAGCSNSRTISGNVVTCAARGINGNAQLTIDNGKWTLFPNPARSVVSLLVETLVGNGQIIVTDLYGKQVKIQTLSMGVNTIDVSRLAKGMYFISTITNEGKTTKKLVVE